MHYNSLIIGADDAKVKQEYKTKSDYLIELTIKASWHLRLVQFKRANNIESLYNRAKLINNKVIINRNKTVVALCDIEDGKITVFSDKPARIKLCNCNVEDVHNPDRVFAKCIDLDNFDTESMSTIAIVSNQVYSCCDPIDKILNIENKSFMSVEYIDPSMWICTMRDICNAVLDMMMSDNNKNALAVDTVIDDSKLCYATLLDRIAMTSIYVNDINHSLSSALNKEVTSSSMSNSYINEEQADQTIFMVSRSSILNSNYNLAIPLQTYSEGEYRKGYYLRLAHFRLSKYALNEHERNRELTLNLKHSINFNTYVGLVMHDCTIIHDNITINLKLPFANNMPQSSKLVFILDLSGAQIRCKKLNINIDMDYCMYDIDRLSLLFNIGKSPIIIENLTVNILNYDFNIDDILNKTCISHINKHGTFWEQGIAEYADYIKIDNFKLLVDNKLQKAYSKEK